MQWRPIGLIKAIINFWGIQCNADTEKLPTKGQGENKFLFKGEKKYSVMLY